MTNRPLISAYLSIFDDWDALPAVLEAIDTVADEVVVVDGAYEWVAPHLGDRDATRSRDEVYDALAPYGRKVKIIRKTWNDEFEKRRAGFEACSNRYIMRFDADEVNFFNHEALDRFFASGLAVAEIDMPTFVTPDFYHGQSVNGIRQSAMFDRTQIDDRQHLDWLWLVLPNYLKQNSFDRAKLFDECIAFTPHLTLWRHPYSASNRALFYVLLWIKNNHGDEALARVAPNMRAWLLGHDIVAGGPLPIDTGHIAPSPLSIQQTSTIVPIYERYLASLSDLNLELRIGRPIKNNEQYNIDISTGLNTDSLGSIVDFSDKINNITAKITSLSCHQPFSRTEIVPISVNGNSAHIEIPPIGDEIRRTLSITADINAEQDVLMRWS